MLNLITTNYLCACLWCPICHSATESYDWPEMSRQFDCWLLIVDCWLLIDIIPIILSCIMLILLIIILPIALERVAYYQIAYFLYITLAVSLLAPYIYIFHVRWCLLPTNLASLTMPCHFTGIFYIQSRGRNVSTYFFDDIGTPWHDSFPSIICRMLVTQRILHFEKYTTLLRIIESIWLWASWFISLPASSW